MRDRCRFDLCFIMWIFIKPGKSRPCIRRFYLGGTKLARQLVELGCRRGDVRRTTVMSELTEST